MSNSDISKLREVLRIVPPLYADEEDIISVLGNNLENLPGLHVQVDSADISDGEIIQEGNRQLPDNLSKALKVKILLMMTGSFPDLRPQKKARQCLSLWQN